MNKLFTEQDIKHLATIPSYERGMDLYDEGAVRKIKVEKKSIVANVQGTNLYTSRLEWTTDSRFDFSCTCPYDRGGVCKHCVALALKIMEKPEWINEITKPQTSSEQKMDIDALIERASEDQIKYFLKEVITTDHALLEKLRTRIYGQTNQESKFSIDEFRNKVKETFESFDLSDYSRFYEYQDTLNGYHEEWEIMLYGAESELEDLFTDFIKQIDQYLEAENIIDAAKGFLALYEGIFIAKLEDIEDEVSIFDGQLFEAVFSLWVTSHDKFIVRFNSIQKEKTALKRIIDVVFDRIDHYQRNRDYHNEFQYSIKILRDFFLTLITDKETAQYMEEKLGKSDLPAEETDDVILAIAEKTDSQDDWLMIAERFYRKNPEIAEKLLKYYENQKTDFVRIASDVAFLWEGRFIPYLYQNLIKNDAPGLYKKILIDHAMTTERIDVYRELKKYYGKETAKYFIAQIREETCEESHFYIKLLEEEKEYSKILEIARSYQFDWLFMDFLKPILNVYPEECFKIISQRTEKELENQTGRDLYFKVAKWLKLLFSIQDNNIRKRSNEFIDDLLTRYSRRPALKDEFKKAGLTENRK